MDPEVNAMSQLAAALEPLDSDARRRVLRWASDRYGTSGGATSVDIGTGNVDTRDSTIGPSIDSSAHETLADLFAAANPKTEAEKVLVAGYWHQVVKGQADLESFQINKDLKNLGHGVSTINREFDRLKEKKPALAVQLKKAGTAKQARKKYKITQAGIDKVRDLLKETT